MPFDNWYLITAAFVNGPNVPIETPAGMTRKPPLTNACCNATTAVPLLPTVKSVAKT